MFVLSLESLLLLCYSEPERRSSTWCVTALSIYEWDLTIKKRSLSKTCSICLLHNVYPLAKNILMWL